MCSSPSPRRPGPEQRSQRPLRSSAFRPGVAETPGRKADDLEVREASDQDLRHREPGVLQTCYF